MKIKLLGTGDEQGVPVSSCTCDACCRARLNKMFRRQSATAKITTGLNVSFIDTGIDHFFSELTNYHCDRLLITNYNNDHIKGLLRSRESTEIPQNIPVYGPKDSEGYQRLNTSNSIWSVQPPLLPFATLNFDGLKVTPLPVNAHRPSFGYLLQYQHNHVAYLSDTFDLPETTAALLSGYELDLLIIDSRYPSTNKNGLQGSNLSIALKIHNELMPKKTVLTHIGHELDDYLLHMNNILPGNVAVGYDGQEFHLR